jgi:hypothetical protein
MPRHLYVVGAAGGVELKNNHGFDINKPFAGCCICGAVYQPNVNLPLEIATQKNIDWRVKHGKTHSERLHVSLAISGRWCTPEAANIFAAYGIISLTDMVMSEEHEVALFESKPIPVKEVES